MTVLHLERIGVAQDVYYGDVERGDVRV